MTPPQPKPPPATLIGLLGAESTGKTTLAQALVQSLMAAGVDAVLVPEALRGFCERMQRPPVAAEQAALARQQTAAIDAATRRHAVVVADTTALMTAVYSEVYFGDAGLRAEARDAHRACHLTLLTATDLPWVADGIQRDGPPLRDRVDTHLRDVLQAEGLAYSVIVGPGPARTEAALRAVWRCLHPPREPAGTPRWRWVCAHCGDGGCEAALHRLPR